MVNNEKTTSKIKGLYESPVIEIIMLDSSDVLTSSGGFNGDDDPILPPDNF